MTVTTKKLFKAILAIAMVAALLLGCVACSKPKDEVDPYADMNDTEYAQALTLNALEDAVDVLTTVSGAYTDLSDVVTGNSGVTAELDLTLGDKVIDLIEQYLFNTTDSGMDLSFLSNINLDMEIDTTDDLAQLQLTLGLSDTEIIALCALLSQDSVWIGAPELNDAYLEINAETLGLPADPQPAWMEKFPEIGVSEAKLDEILTRYLTMAVKEIDTVERTNETLELDGLKQDCAKLTIKIYEQDALDAAKAVLTAVKDDQDIKKICDDYTTVYNEMLKEYGDMMDGATEIDAYAEFIAGVEDALEELPEKAETESYIALTLYVDGKHNIIGSSLDIPALYEEKNEAAMASAGTTVTPSQSATVASSLMYTQYTVTEGNNFKSLFEIESIGLKITGSGTTDDGAITGTYAIIIDGLTFGNVELKDFDAADDTVSGTIILKPAKEITELIFKGSIPFLDVTDVALEIKLDVSKNKEDIDIKLIGDDALIVGLALKSATKAPAAIEKPTNTVPATGMEPVMNWISEIDFDTVINKLTDAGVPGILVGALQSLIPAA